MISLMVESSTMVVRSWVDKIAREGGEADISIDADMRSFSGDLISRACFGSNYFKGKEIFIKLRALQEALSKRMLAPRIPGLRYPCAHVYFLRPRARYRRSSDYVFGNVFRDNDTVYVR